MIGETCEYCRDDVLILKILDGKRLCLDCYCKYKDGKTPFSKKDINISKENQFADDSHAIQIKQNSDRRCPNCGRIIPFDSIVCPYCVKKI